MCRWSHVRKPERDNMIRKCSKCGKRFKTLGIELSAWSARQNIDGLADMVCG